MGMGGGKGDTPAAPDYRGAAQETAAGNLEMAREQTKANRVNQYTPYGNLIYSQGNGERAFNQSAYDAAMNAYTTSLQNATGGTQPGDAALFSGRTQIGGPLNGGKPPNPEDFYYNTGDPGQWSSRIELSPVGQQLLDYDNQISLGMGKAGVKGLEHVQSTLDKPFNWDNLPTAPINAGTTAQEAIMARLRPQMQRDRDAFAQQMANQGISAGGDAYNNANRQMFERENDLLSQAALRGIDLDQQARQQAIQEQSFARTEPLNILSALRSGSQVNLPQFTSVPQQQFTPGPDMLGATTAAGDYATDVYNAKTAQQGSTMGLLGSAAMAAAMFF